MTDDRPRLRELIAVEGLHDRQAVELAVLADVWVLGGDRISRRTLAELRRAVGSRGVIVLTDPDGAGERIRRRLDAALPGCRHAYLPRSGAAGKRGVGVEYARPEVIRSALAEARATAIDQATDPVYTMADLERVGMVGAPGAAKRRLAVGEQLGIGTGNAKAFLRKLNVLGISEPEWREAVEAVCEANRTAST